MKKLLFTAAVALFAFTASAQWEQGNILVYGGSNLGIMTSSSTFELGSLDETDGPTGFNFNFSPQAGLFIADGFLVGLKLDFNSMKSTTTTEIGDDEYETEGTSSHFTVGPMVRYYIGDSGLFGKAYVCFGSANSQDQFLEIDFVSGDVSVEDGDEMEQSILAWGIGAGYAIMLNDHIALEPCVSFGGMTYTTKDVDYIDEDGEEQTDDAKDKRTGLTVSVGISGILD